MSLVELLAVVDEEREDEGGVLPPGWEVACEWSNGETRDGELRLIATGPDGGQASMPYAATCHAVLSRGQWLIVAARAWQAHQGGTL